MTRELQLIENPHYGSDLKSTAMEIAGQLREEGYSPSEALSEGWSRAKEGYDRELYEQLDIPYDNPKPRRRRTTTTFQSGGLTNILLLAGIGYLGWCGVQWYRTKTWSWTPWKTTMARRILALPRHRVNPATISHQSVVPVAPPRGLEYEGISIILP